LRTQGTISSESSFRGEMRRDSVNIEPTPLNSFPSPRLCDNFTSPAEDSYRSSNISTCRTSLPVPSSLFPQLPLLRSSRLSLLSSTLSLHYTGRARSHVPQPHDPRPLQALCVLFQLTCTFLPVNFISSSRLTFSYFCVLGTTISTLSLSGSLLLITSSPSLLSPRHSPPSPFPPVYYRPSQGSLEARVQIEHHAHPASHPYTPPLRPPPPTLFPTYPTFPFRSPLLLSSLHLCTTNAIMPMSDSLRDFSRRRGRERDRDTFSEQDLERNRVGKQSQSM